MNRLKTTTRLIYDNPQFVGDHEQAQSLAHKIALEVIEPVETAAFSRGYEVADNFHTDREED